MLSSPRRPLRTIRIFSSAENVKSTALERLRDDRSDSYGCGGKFMRRRRAWKRARRRWLSSARDSREGAKEWQNDTDSTLGGNESKNGAYVEQPDR